MESILGISLFSTIPDINFAKIYKDCIDIKTKYNRKAILTD